MGAGPRSRRFRPVECPDRDPFPFQPPASLARVRGLQQFASRGDRWARLLRATSLTASKTTAFQVLWEARSNVARPAVRRGRQHESGSVLARGKDSDVGGIDEVVSEVVAPPPTRLVIVAHRREHREGNRI